MGINPIADEMIRALRLPPGFTVIELGDQFHHTGYRKSPGWSQRPAIHFYRELGASDYQSLDANGRATIYADLNKPLYDGAWPDDMCFDLVTDFGTSEHVWDIAQCWRTIHSLCKPGGFIAFEKPGQGYHDHGFWNVHPTTWKDLARANAYEIVHLKEYKAERGALWRGVYRKTSPAALVAPVQGKYRGKVRM